MRTPEQSRKPMSQYRLFMLPALFISMMSLALLSVSTLNAAEKAKPHTEHADKHADHAEHADHEEKASPKLPTLVRWTLNFGFCVLMLGSLLCLYRLLIGPHLADRVLAGDALGLHIVGVAILIITATELVSYFDAVLVIALVGFASTFAFAQFIARRHSDHDEAVKKEKITTHQTESATTA